MTEKKSSILIYVIIMIMLVVLISSASYVNAVTKPEVRVVLGITFREYLENSSTHILTPDEVSDLFKYYRFGIPLDILNNENLNLDITGERSGEKIINIYNKASLAIAGFNTNVNNMCSIKQVCVSDYLSASQLANCTLVNPNYCANGCREGICSLVSIFNITPINNTHNPINNLNNNSLNNISFFNHTINNSIFDNSHNISIVNNSINIVENISNNLTPHFTCIFKNSANLNILPACKQVDADNYAGDSLEGTTWCRGNDVNLTNRYCILNSSAISDNTKTWVSTFCSNETVTIINSSTNNTLVFDCKNAQENTFVEQVTCKFKNSKYPQYCYIDSTNPENDTAYDTFYSTTELDNSTLFIRGNYGYNLPIKSSCSLETRILTINNTDPVLLFDCSSANGTGKIRSNNEIIVKEKINCILHDVASIHDCYALGTDVSIKAIGRNTESRSSEKIIETKLGIKFNWTTNCPISTNSSYYHGNYTTTTQDANNEDVIFICAPENSKYCIDNSKTYTQPTPVSGEKFYKCIQGQWLEISNEEYLTLS